MSQTNPITFDTSQLEKVAASAGLSEEDLRNIWRLSLDDTTNWAHKESAKQLGQDLKVPYPAMRKRIRANRRTNPTEASLWYGFNPIGLKHLKAKQDGDGVTTTANKVPGAFIVPMLNSHVFKRTGEKRLMKRGIYRGKMREAIEKQSLPVDDYATTVLSTKMLPKVADYFMDRLFFHLDRALGQAEGTSRKQFEIK